MEFKQFFECGLNSALRFFERAIAKAKPEYIGRIDEKLVHHLTKINSTLIFLDIHKPSGPDGILSNCTQSVLSKVGTRSNAPVPVLLPRYDN